jgi:hypothetical protein
MFVFGTSLALRLSITHYVLLLAEPVTRVQLPHRNPEFKNLIIDYGFVQTPLSPGKTRCHPLPRLLLFKKLIATVYLASDAVLLVMGSPNTMC